MSHILFGTESEKTITKKCHRSSILQQPSSPANKMVISLKNQNFFWKIFLKHYATWTFRSYLAGLSVIGKTLLFLPSLSLWMNGKSLFCCCKRIWHWSCYPKWFVQGQTGSAMLCQCCASVQSPVPHPSAFSADLGSVENWPHQGKERLFLWFWKVFVKSEGLI